MAGSTQDPTSPELRIEFANAKRDLTSCGFRLGRGGVCLPGGRRLDVDGVVDLEVLFRDEDQVLRGQGHVQWTSPNCGCAGIAFRYIAPESRAWLFERIAKEEPRSFIPECRGIAGGANGRRTGTFQPSRT